MDLRTTVGAGLAAGRLAAGVAALVAPRLVERAVGLRPGAHPDGPYLVALFGSRELLVGAAAAGVLGPGTARRGLRLGAAVDVLDALAVLRAHRDGRFDARRAGTLATGCLAIAATGWAAGGGA